MSRYFLALAFLVTVGLSVGHAQFEHTYITDRRFDTPDDLLGYTFVPNEVQEPDQELPRKLNAGSVRLRVQLGYLTLVSNEVETAFSTVSINPTEYGFKLELMNAIKPAEQGHLKIFLNDNREVDALAFKPKREEKEVVFYQASITPRIIERDGKYFTDVKGLNLANIQFIFGKKVKPFFKMDNEKKRIYPQDSLSFVFSEREVTVGKKTKKEQFVMFRFRKVTETDDLMEEMEFMVKKITQSEYERKGQKGKVWELELKDFPGGSLMLYCSPQMYLMAVQFGKTVFYLRDKTAYPE